MPLPRPIPLNERAAIEFVGRTQIDVRDGAFEAINAEGMRAHIPIGGIACLVREPGAWISHAAVALAGQVGTLITSGGEGGVRLYSTRQPGRGRTSCCGRQRWPVATHSERPGSCVIVPGQKVIGNLMDFTLAAIIRPTLTKEVQRTIMALPGLASIGIGKDGRLTGQLNTAASVCLQSSQPVEPDQWHVVSLSFEDLSNRLTLSLTTVRESASLPAEIDSQTAVLVGLHGLTSDECIIAANRDADGELTSFYDGKIDRPAIFADVVDPYGLIHLLSDFKLLERQRNLAAAWDFSRRMTMRTICNVSPYRLDGVIHNAPARAMTGWLWKGQELDWNKRPELYSAIHFHATDLYDAGWRVDFTFTIPEDLKSGVYAVRLVPDGDEGAAYYCVIAVRPPRDHASGNSVAFLFPTCSYMAYANHRLGMDVPGTEIGLGRAVELDRHHMFLQKNPEIGFSVYGTHDDVSGVFHTSRLRPIVDMQPEVKLFLGGLGSSIWQCNADTHILGWLDNIDQDYDVITDEDVDAEGLRLLERYNVILTGSHPEYYTNNMVSGLQSFTDRGGRLMYLGGNGFYWVVSFNEDMPGIMECRRSEAGIRPWEPGHGQFYHGFTGENAGLRRRNGRPPNHLCGVGMTSQGFDVSEPYVASPEASNPRAEFIFDGIDQPVIGDFGLAGGGAAGLELDRADAEQGALAHALVLASSTRHTDIYLMTLEDLLDPTPDWSGTQCDIVRADLTFFETPGGGAVFSVGSIAWPGAMVWNSYDNEIAKMTENVLKRFDNPVPFEMP